MKEIAKLADYQIITNSASLAKIDGQSFTITQIEDSNYTQGDEVTKGVKLTMKESFSIESDLFPRLCLKNNLKAVIHNSKFIDIGIPEDYYKFCKLNTDNE